MDYEQPSSESSDSLDKGTKSLRGQVNMDNDYATRLKERLIHQVRGTSSMLIAFSGGVDSSLLLAMVQEILGDNVVAATAISDIFPVQEKEVASKFAQDRGIEHIVFRSEAMNLPAFVSNGPDRCYHCKKLLFQTLRKSITYCRRQRNKP